jgi:predicted DCC family thiol-disulfide oxidoreductase YuxK
MYVVLYDDACGICSHSAAWLARQRLHGELRFLPAGSEEARRLLPDRPADKMAVLGPSGEVWLGGDGWIECLRLTQRYRVIAGIFGLPGLRACVHGVYALVARHRHRISRLLGYRACRV